ncbi:crossover junction endodeoxyribonuclease Ecym_2570 [Eremothecium cymbalariae DBVPG|uniref:XPG-I domain-containing protein n=1 Tax=Eremothecium cymbalariae (strain CBS 270.75 / DBVPG 7215 / KCTC 17166 / NRRL Y-17582) TaxID=931890 RepID=G8JQC9_ERECY|nr:Hypothetical protein Ecym_2570 [Eremothecium cymbalariae DBVPG\
MGTSELWEITNQHCETKRLLFDQFVGEYRRTCGRSPRIAIDAFQWLFECGFICNSSNNNEHEGLPCTNTQKATLNLVSKLKYFISLDLEFVLVFDGPEKPAYKRKMGKKKAPLPAPNREFLHTAVQWQRTNEVDSAVIMAIDICENFKVEVIIGKGEAEAECARLQSDGVVDYVLSNDSDSLVFGATKVLKNFSKYRQDLPSSGTSPLRKRSSDFFVTVVDIDETTRRYPTINRKAFMLFTILVGADYNTGLRHLGLKRAWSITQWANGRFSSHLWTICPQLKEENTEGESFYDQFKLELIEECQKNAKQIFGQNLHVFTRSSDTTVFNWPSINAIQSYYDPKVHKINFGGRLFTKGNSAMGKFQPFSNLYNLLLDNRIHNLLKDFNTWYHQVVHTCALLKTILYDDNQATGNMKITETKVLKFNDEYNIPLWKVRYKTFLLDFNNSPTQIEETSPTKNSPSRRQLCIREYPYSQWLLKSMIPEDHPLTREFRELEQRESLAKYSRKRSPTRQRYHQEQTLDSFINSQCSPIKRRRLLLASESPDNIINISASSSDDSITILDMKTPEIPKLSPLQRPHPHQNPLQESPTIKTTLHYNHRLSPNSAPAQKRECINLPEAPPHPLSPSSLSKELALTKLKEPERIRVWFTTFFEYAQGNYMTQQGIWNSYMQFQKNTLQQNDTILSIHDLSNILDGTIPRMSIQHHWRGKFDCVFYDIRPKNTVVAPHTATEPPCLLQNLSPTRRKLTFDYATSDTMTG